MKAVKKINEVFGQTARGFAAPSMNQVEVAGSPKAAISQKIQPANDTAPAMDALPTEGVSLNDRRNAMAGSMLADVFFGAVLGMPTMDFAGAELEAGTVADMVDEFQAERNKPAPAQPEMPQSQPTSYLSSLFTASHNGKGIKEIAVEPWETWLQPTPVQAPAPVM